MAFFKILSDDPSDFQEEVSGIYEHESDDGSCIELVLDTGETYIIPVAWLLHAARANGFDCIYNARMH